MIEVDSTLSGIFLIQRLILVPGTFRLIRITRVFNVLNLVIQSLDDIETLRLLIIRTAIVEHPVAVCAIFNENLRSHPEPS